MKITIKTLEGTYHVDASYIEVTTAETPLLSIKDAAKRLGRMTSQKKATAAHINGLKGGRPKEH